MMGVSQSNFSDAQAEFLEGRGNKRERAVWWAKFDPAKNPKVPAGNPWVAGPLEAPVRPAASNPVLFLRPSPPICFAGTRCARS